MSKSIRDLVIEYFKDHPNQDLRHGDIVDWVEDKYVELYGKKPRDTWRTIRKLHQEGMLIRVSKGVHRYEPEKAHVEELFDFPSDVKEAIFKRDNYRCVVCGQGRQSGIEICADHIIPKDRGGRNTLENGQTLCTQHNLIKKNYSQTEAGKRFFIKMYEQAQKIGDTRMMSFCTKIFDIYDEYGVDFQIPRPDK